MKPIKFGTILFHCCFKRLPSATFAVHGAKLKHPESFMQVL